MPSDIMIRQLIVLTAFFTAVSCGNLEDKKMIEKTKQMMEKREQNKAIVKELYAKLMGNGDMETADRLISEDYVDHRLPDPGLPKTREGLKQTVMAVRNSFPDIKPEILQILAEGDMVSVRVVAKGTHQKDFLGVKATNKSMEWNEIHIFRLDNGQIMEHWGEFDMLGILIQLGAFPAPGN